MDNPVPLTTGDIRYGADFFDVDGRMDITSQEAFPVNISGIFGTMEANPR